MARRKRASSGKIFSDTLETYERIIDLVLPLSLLVLLVSSFLMLASTYISGGAGFVGYLDILSSSPTDALIILIVSIAGLFAFSFLSVGVTALVKFKRTFDDLSFIKLANRSMAYAMRVSVGWFFLAVISFIIGGILTALDAPTLFLPLSLALIWWGAIFLPQTVVLEDKRVIKAFAQSFRYSIRYWKQILVYYVITTALVGIIVVFEVLLEQMSFFYWTAPFISSILLFLFVVPFVEILKCEWYMSTKYKITAVGLK